jgi:hypothetical protein
MGGDYDSIGKAADALFRGMLTLLFLFVPLGLWKLIDIFLWLWENVEIGLK